MKEISSVLSNGDPGTSKRLRNEAPARAGKLRRLPSGERQLTAREKEILCFLAFGFGTSAIARELSISPATVRNHAQRILAKLQVHSRLAAVARGYAIGLLPSPRRPSSTRAPAVELPSV